ncbi:hypothetical protein MPH_00952 [Macrophomina phaseolina MS6]|uniref:Uncharacterized protein n=1 Tax=Macrophomina phaseolina (strain MS6) TaxID=1126212 RepID=K2SA19_MACPH|nr:hypothetical protein MPH_00952 [Macrophomina phaseolina MS6]
MPEQGANGCRQEEKVARACRKSKKHSATMVFLIVSEEKGLKALHARRHRKCMAARPLIHECTKAAACLEQGQEVLALSISLRQGKCGSHSIRAVRMCFADAYEAENVVWAHKPSRILVRSIPPAVEDGRRSPITSQTNGIDADASSGFRLRDHHQLNHRSLASCSIDFCLSFFFFFML